MRPLKELLQILLDEVDKSKSLAYNIGYVFFNRLSDNEGKLIDEWYLKIKEKGETSPRIEFLKNEIEELN